MTQNSLASPSIGDAKNATSSSMTSYGARPRNMANHLSKDSRNSEAEIRKLQQQLQDIKEQVKFCEDEAIFVLAVLQSRRLDLLCAWAFGQRNFIITNSQPG